MARVATKVNCFKRMAGQNYIEVYTYKERLSGVDVVHRCFSEGFYINITPSEAAGYLITSFSSWLIDRQSHLISQDRMCTYSS